MKFLVESYMLGGFCKQSFGFFVCQFQLDILFLGQGFCSDLESQGNKGNFWQIVFLRGVILMLERCDFQVRWFQGLNSRVFLQIYFKGLGWDGFRIFICFWWGVGVQLFFWVFKIFFISFVQVCGCLVLILLVVVRIEVSLVVLFVSQVFVLFSRSLLFGGDYV